MKTPSLPKKDISLTTYKQAGEVIEKEVLKLGTFRQASKTITMNLSVDNIQEAKRYMPLWYKGYALISHVFHMCDQTLERNYSD